MGKTAVLVLLKLFINSKKDDTPMTPPRAFIFSRTLFSNVNIIQSMIPEGHYNVITQWCKPTVLDSAAFFVGVLSSSEPDSNPAMSASPVSTLSAANDKCSG